jgi:hypothetical protein
MRAIAILALWTGLSGCSALDCESPQTWWVDADGDLFGDPNNRVEACEQPPGTVNNGDDCDDSDVAFRPGAPEDDCTDPNDYNCDGSAGYEDADGDGFFACEECDDAHANAYPGGTEVCDGLDNDCDGFPDVDAVDAPTWYGDSDGDGYGGHQFQAVACEAPDFFVANDDDCDDLDADANPDGVEVCDGADNDCDGVVDDSALDAELWYPDLDGDGFGDPSDPQFSCEPDAGSSEDPRDCDDGESDIHPDAEEICNDGIDNDCDGTFEGCTVDVADVASVFTGVVAGDAAGTSVSPAGDLDADGNLDWIVGADLESTNGYAAGAAYVVYGPLSAGTTGDLYSSGTALTGRSESRLGQRVAAAGDVDGDGFDDVWVTAHRDSTSAAAAGSATLFFGPLSADVDLSTDASGTASWLGETAYDRVGLGLTALGDVDGDGLDDVAIGAPYYDASSTLKDSGAVYLVLGGSDWSETQSLGEADAVLEGDVAKDELGRALAAADVDGDGIQDLFVGTPKASSTGAGAGGVVWIPGADLASATLLNQGTAIAGESAGDAAGHVVSAIGDVDGDGYDEVLVGAPGHDSGGTDAGAAYVIAGTSGGPSLADLSLASAVLVGPRSDSFAGSQVAGGGDVDGDGTPDVVVGAWQSGTLGQGAAWIVSGADLSGTVDLGTQPRIDGHGSADGLGASAAIVGDMDGDGDSEVVLTAPGADDNGTDAGAAYLLFDVGL